MRWQNVELYMRRLFGKHSRPSLYLSDWGAESFTIISTALKCKKRLANAFLIHQRAIKAPMVQNQVAPAAVTILPSKLRGI
jgi:hypothetical protein